MLVKRGNAFESGGRTLLGAARVVYLERRTSTIEMEAFH